VGHREGGGCVPATDLPSPSSERTALQDPALGPSPFVAAATLLRHRTRQDAALRTPSLRVLPAGERGTAIEQAAALGLPSLGGVLVHGRGSRGIGTVRF